MSIHNFRNQRENNRKDISEDSIYYFMDRLNNQYKDQVEEISFGYTKSLFSFSTLVVTIFWLFRPDNFPPITSITFLF